MIWEEHVMVDSTLGNGSRRYPAMNLKTWAEDGASAAITMHVCYLALLNGNGKKFRVGPKWWAMVERHGAEITADSEA